MFNQLFINRHFILSQHLIPPNHIKFIRLEFGKEFLHKASRSQDYLSVLLIAFFIYNHGWDIELIIL